MQALLKAQVLFGIVFCLLSMGCTHNNSDEDPHAADIGVYVGDSKDGEQDRLMFHGSDANMYFETSMFFSANSSELEDRDSFQNQKGERCRVLYQGHPRALEGQLFSFYVLTAELPTSGSVSESCYLFLASAALRLERLWQNDEPLVLTVDRAKFRKVSSQITK